MVLMARVYRYEFVSCFSGIGPGTTFELLAAGTTKKEGSFDHKLQLRRLKLR